MYLCYLSKNYNDKKYIYIAFIDFKIMSLTIKDPLCILYTYYML